MNDKKINDISDFFDKSILWNKMRFKIADYTHGIRISLELGTGEKLKQVVAYIEKMVNDLKQNV